MTRDHAGHWCKWTARHPLWMEVRVRGPRCPLRNPLEKNQGEACPWIPFFRGVSTTVSVSVFQTDDAGSIPVHRSIRVHARWEFPGGAVMTMWIVSDIRASVLFDGHADYRRRPSFQDDANSPRRRGRRESDQPIRPVRKRFPETWVTASLVSRPTGCGNGLGGAWASQPVILVMPHAAVCASTASMSARIRHEWPDRLWTARAYPCGLPAHAFVAQPVEAMR